MLPPEISNVPSLSLLIPGLIDPFTVPSLIIILPVLIFLIPWLYASVALIVPLLISTVPLDEFSIGDAYASWYPPADRILPPFIITFSVPALFIPL